MHRKKLGKRHLSLFDRRGSASIGDSAAGLDHLFDQFAQAVCYAGVVARKEIFETWASALYIHSSFFGNEATMIDRDIPRINRVADVAAGHGLLAWALLLLDDEHRRRCGNDDEHSHRAPLTAFCLDVKMPQSAEIVHSSMLRRWAHLDSQFHYVEGRLEQLAPHPSCLLASVHGCGILSDILVSAAAEHGVPMAIVPCCHSRKSVVLDVASPFAKDLYYDIINTNGSVTDLSERLDEARMTALMNSGHEVKEIFLPKVSNIKTHRIFDPKQLRLSYLLMLHLNTKIFTEKNRLIVSLPPGTQQPKPSLPDPVVNRLHQPLDVARKGRMPSLDQPILPKLRFLKGFCVPCKDDEVSRLIVSDLAGRVAANHRKEVMHNRYHTKYPHLDLSLWLPEEDVGISEDAISHIVESKNKVECTVAKVGPVYVSRSGRSAQTFRIQYAPSDDTGMLSFDDARRMHEELYATIPISFPGAECR